MSRRAALAVAAVVALFFLVRLARFDPERVSADLLYYLGRAAVVTWDGDPGELLAPDYIGRRHPLFLAALAGSFGATIALPLVSVTRLLLVLTYAGHLLATLLLGRLVRNLGGSPRAALGTGLAFAVFGGANNLFADVNHFTRTWGLALALGALLALRSGRAGLAVGLYALSLLNFEDALFLPLAAIAAERLVPPDRLEPPARRRSRLAHAAMLVAAASFLAYALAATPPAARPLASAGEAAAKLALLPLEVARQAVVLRSDLLAPAAPRLLLALAATAILVAGVAPRRLPWPALGALGALCLAFSLPYLLRPTGLAWPSRYLYFPAAALLAAAALACSLRPRRVQALALVYLGLVGLGNSERAAEVIARRHLHRFEAVHLPQAVVFVYGQLTGTVVDRPSLSPADCAFLATVHTPSPIPCRSISATIGR